MVRRCCRWGAVMVASASKWWHGAVIYHVYPRSFADSNGDGIGDLPGITAHMDHVASLGVDAVWISPFFPSLGIILCVLLMLSLPSENWLQLVIWLLAGLAIYFFYGFWHSKLRQTKSI